MTSVDIIYLFTLHYI